MQTTDKRFTVMDGKSTQKISTRLPSHHPWVVEMDQIGCVASGQLSGNVHPEELQAGPPPEPSGAPPGISAQLPWFVSWLVFSMSCP